jgi:serine/threonine protein kinase
MPEFEPIRFGKYLLLKEVARGGMARLYWAKITGAQGFRKLIAIKCLLSDLAAEKELVSSFIDEAHLAALLTHQNIVQINDFGQEKETYFIAMEYLFGRDIRHIFEKSREMGKPLSVEYALSITSKICSGLDYAHRLKDLQGEPLHIIHRDISPQNIIVTYEGDVKIVDFGIAKAASQSNLTQTGMIKGKVAYMSPEQAAGKKIDHRSDIFSTGVLLYEMVTNKRMFTGDTFQILAQVREAKIPWPETMKSDLPGKVCDILERSLTKKPENRYQSCSEILADIEACMNELSMRPTTQGLAQYMQDLFQEEIAQESQAMREALAIDVKDEEDTIPPEPKPVQTTPGPRPWRRYGGVVALLAVVCLFFAFVYKSNLMSWYKGKDGAKVTEIAQPKIPKNTITPQVTQDSMRSKGQTERVKETGSRKDTYTAKKEVNRVDKVVQPPPPQRPPSPQITPTVLENEINASLRNSRIMGVKAQVNESFQVTLKGTVNTAAEKDAAIQVTKGFKGSQGIRYNIVVLSETFGGVSSSYGQGSPASPYSPTSPDSPTMPGIPPRPDMPASLPWK